MRSNRPQYINQPPSFPDFIFKISILPYEELIEWAKKEHRAWIRHLAENGSWKQLKWFNENVSPYRILAEMSGFRRYVAYLNGHLRWPGADERTKDFLARAWGLREFLIGGQ